MLRRLLIMSVISLFSVMAIGQDKDPNTLRVFTWSGYVTPEEVAAVNKLLEAAGNPVRVKVIDTTASGPDQMHGVIASGQADLSFLTLNYIKMSNEKTAKLLQPINVNSPRLTNYKNVIDALKAIPYGMSAEGPLYVPYGGGAYGIWANMKKIKKEELPKSVKDLLDPKWKGKLSLTKGQVQPNVALAMMILGQKPWAMEEMVATGKNADATKMMGPGSELQKTLDQLYGQVATFWNDVPEFKEPLVSSYGIEIAELRKKGEDWQLVPFSEGNTVWLDTMNIMKTVSGKKLEAAEIFINYFLGAEVQNRVVNGLSMVAAVKGVKNPLIDNNPNFFAKDMFWPPYHPVTDGGMKGLSQRAMLSATKK